MANAASGTGIRIYRGYPSLHFNRPRFRTTLRTHGAKVVLVSQAVATLNHRHTVFDFAFNLHYRGRLGTNILPHMLQEIAEEVSARKNLSSACHLLLGWLSLR